MQLILAEAGAQAGAWAAAASCMDLCAAHKLDSERMDHFVKTHWYPKPHTSVDSRGQALMTALVHSQILLQELSKIC